MRLFFALLPSTADRTRLYSLTEGLLAKGIGRCVPADNWHITLHFVGEVAAANAALLCQVLTQAYLADAISKQPVFPLTLHCGGLGWFRAGTRGILWLRVQPSAPLDRFHRMLLAHLKDAGWVLPPAARRPLRPHLTIARDVPLQALHALKQRDERFNLARPPTVAICLRSPLLLESRRDPGRDRVVYRIFCAPQAAAAP